MSIGSFSASCAYTKASRIALRAEFSCSSWFIASKAKKQFVSAAIGFWWAWVATELEAAPKILEETDVFTYSFDMKITLLLILSVFLMGCDADTERGRAERGDVRAQFSLAIAYANGKGVQKDNVEAAKWYRKAAEQGHVVARLTLGLCYAEGEGVPKDSALAYMWINIAAAQGYHLAVSQRDIIAQRMTKEQIAEGQKLTREWMAKHSEE